MISNKSLFLALLSLLSIPLNIFPLTSKHFSPKQLSSSILLCQSFSYANLLVVLNSFVFFFIPLDQNFSLPLPYVCPFIFPVSYLPEVPRPSSPYKSFLFWWLPLAITALSHLTPFWSIVLIPTLLSVVPSGPTPKSTSTHSQQ